MLAPDLIAVLAYLATGVENAALEDENSPHKAGVLFVDPLFARKVRLLSFFAGHRLMNAEPDAIMADWRRLTVAIQIYCDNIPKESAGIAKPMLQFLGRDSHRLLDEQPRRGEDQHVVEQVPVVRGVVVKGFLKACKDVALNLKLAGHEAEEALDMYDGRAIPAEEVGWNDLRSLSTAVSAEVAKPNGSTGAPFFFNPAIVSGLFKLCHGRIVDIDEYGKQRFAFADLHSRIQTGLLQLVAGVAEAAGFAIEKEGDETRVKAKGNRGKSYPIPSPMGLAARRVADFPLSDFGKDLELLNALALKAVQHIQSLSEDAVNWDNQCDKYSIEIARQAIYECGFEDYAGGNVPTGLTVEQFFRVKEAEEAEEPAEMEAAEMEAAEPGAAEENVREISRRLKAPPDNHVYRKAGTKQTIRAEFEKGKQGYTVGGVRYCITAPRAIEVMTKLLKAFENGNAFVKLPKKWAERFSRDHARDFKKRFIEMAKDPNGNKFVGEARIRLPASST